MNLSWMLAAHLQGWAPASILDAHEKERLPTVEQVSRLVADYAQHAIRERTTLPVEIEADTPEGAAARARIGLAAYQLHVQQFACAGWTLVHAATFRSTRRYHGPDGYRCQVRRADRNARRLL